LRTFNVRFSEKKYDETWAAQMVARHIGSHHESLDMNNIRGTWDHVTSLLLHAGQPFADPSLFAVNAICRLMRQHVTVAISGDGGDEAFGGYDVYWRLSRIARFQRLPTFLRASAHMALNPLSRFGISSHLLQRMKDLRGADDTSVIQSLFSSMSEWEHERLFDDRSLLPVRRLFEKRWEFHLPERASRIERLSAHATEINTRLTLANGFLFKVDIASMKESLEVRVPMLDEELFAFGLSLPHDLKVNGRICKRTLRAVAARRLPPAVATKPKQGFSLPLESWVGPDLKVPLRHVLTGASSRLPEFFRRDAFQPVIDAFFNGQSGLAMPLEEAYRRAIMLLSVHLALCGKN
jgi:asparagine synthase (glutamine-hydrolysing)